MKVYLGGIPSNPKDYEEKLRMEEVDVIDIESGGSSFRLMMRIDPQTLKTVLEVGTTHRISVLPRATNIIHITKL